MRIPPTVETEYRLSPRVVLRPGDRFKASAGPYYRLDDGRRVPMAARGTFVLVEIVRQRTRVFLLAYGRDGWALLHVEGRRRSRVPGLVCRPYKIRRASRVDTRRADA
jgi:hypothetical protein